MAEQLGEIICKDPVDTRRSEILCRNKPTKGDWILFSISKHAPQFLLHRLRLTPSAKILK